MMLHKAAPGQEGQASASLNLADVLGTALGIGAGGAAVAAAAGGDLRPGVAAAFVITGAVGLVTLVFTRRLPAGTTSAPPPPPGPGSGPGAGDILDGLPPARAQARAEQEPADG
jgi:hypothetical protein